MGQELGDYLFEGIHEPDSPSSARVLGVALVEQDGEGEDPEEELDEDAEPTEELALGLGLVRHV